MIRDMGLHKMGAFYAGMFLFALVVARLGGFNAFISVQPDADALVSQCALGALAGLAWAGLSAAGSRFSPRLARVDQELARLIGPMDVQEALIMAAYSGLCEEVLFRGALLPLVGPAWSSLMFASAHLPPRRDLWPWTVMAGVAGGGLAWLTLSTGSIVAAVMAHAVVNAVGLVQLGRLAGKQR